jgi:hypothetical protein
MESGCADARRADATVWLLQMNAERRLELRAELIKRGLF